ncbi:MAG: alpha/beta fold hydrolase [Anaerolineae bacterium]|nr:alpha/beta fold hydrolase [Anaerolineae bacterium]
MGRKTVLLLIVIWTALLLAPVQAQDELPYVELADCWMGLPDGLVEGENVDCGLLYVPEDRTDPDSATIELAFAILYAAEDAQPDPVIYLAGGPGGNAVDELEAWVDIPYIQDRDLILLDQRGTGYSFPSLNCPEIEESEDNATQACRDRLVADGVNLQAYNSAENAADVADLRVALGYEEWNLYGISYGTRLALTVMRDYPEGVRSVTIDSVYPPEINSWEEYGQNTVETFATLFDACAVDSGCAASFPDLEGVFYAAVDDLNAQPAEYATIDPDTGNGIEVSLSGTELIDRLFQLMYSTDSIPYLPWMIYEVADGNYTALDDLETGAIFEQERRRQDVDEDITDSEGMNLSVECQEEVGFLSEITALESVPAEPAALAENSISAIEQTFSDCRIWDVALGDAVETEPVVSDIPTLVAAGEFDPITPAKWAESAASHLSNSFFFVFPGGGHGVIDMNECSQGIMQDFLDDPTQEPDGSCIEAMGPVPWALP